MYANFYRTRTPMVGLPMSYQGRVSVGGTYAALEHVSQHVQIGEFGIRKSIKSRNPSALLVFSLFPYCRLRS